MNVYEDRFYYGEEGNRIIASVRNNTNLDYWDGRNFYNGGLGLHKGITKLKDGRYVIIINSDWQGERNYAYVVSKREALEEILESGNLELLKEKRFAELKMMHDELKDKEELDEE